MLSLAVANDYELHACDIEQAFLQADKLPEGVNGRYFIQPPPGSPDANNRDVVYEVCRPLYGNPSSPRALHKTLDAYFMSEGFEHVGFEESVWVRPKGGKYGEDIYVSTHVDDCLICCKSTTTMSKFKQETEQPRRAKWYKQDMLSVYCVLLECGIAILCSLLWTQMYV